jgi:hypothetical protein
VDTVLTLSTTGREHGDDAWSGVVNVAAVVLPAAPNRRVSEDHHSSQTPTTMESPRLMAVEHPAAASATTIACSGSADTFRRRG